MEYNKLGTVLKRFSFEEKMRIAQVYSRKTFTSKGIVDVNTLREIPTPWELETFVLFSIKATEWKNDDFKGKNERKFEQIINCIRNENPPVMELSDGEELLTWLFVTMASVQFEIQEHYPFKIFRFNFLFSYTNENIDMPSLFRNKFGCDYYEYSLLGHLLWTLFTTNTFTQALFATITTRFAVPISHLILTRKNYIDTLDKITTDPENYLFCLRPSYSYPFVDYNNIAYCPLPHLLRRATTSSLMHRLTDGNSKLMTLIGKEVYEAYLYKIINESGIFDEVISEKTYTYHRTPHRTADVMARRGSEYVFFDSKSFTPKTAIRTFSQDALDKDVQRLAESCVQVYKHIRQRFLTEYCYFQVKPEDVSVNIYGLVIVQENPYIRGQAIYKKAAQILGISECSDEFTWLYTHVGITSVYAIERHCFTGTDMCPSLRKTCEEKLMTHTWLTEDTGGKITYNCYQTFLEKINEDMIQIVEQLAK